MKKVLIILAAIALLAWLITAVVSRILSSGGEAVATSAASPWPGGLGRLDGVAGRYPPVEANDASGKLINLAKTLPRSEAVDEFVRREIVRGELAIGEPPALSDVAAIRQLLLREPVVWPRRGGIVEVGDPQTSSRRGLQMTMARALVASALARARAGDSAAWDDLRAVWNLAQSLEHDPQMMVQTAALSMARMINAVAWKMPLPAPEWFAEVQQRDSVRPLLEAFQYQTAAYWGDTSVVSMTWQADWLEHERRIAERLFVDTGCDASAPVNKHGPDLTSLWRRAFRYRAEREATANALRVRSGRPIEPRSRCGDAAWSFDGTTLRFSREIATPAPDAAMPLVLRLHEG